MLLKKNVDSMGSSYQVIAQKMLGKDLADLHHARDVYFILNRSGSLVGMISTTPHNQYVLRINAFGLIPGSRKKGIVLRYLKEFLDETTREGWMSILSTVEPELLSLFLKVGAKVVGINLGQLGNPLIEVAYYGKSVLHTKEGKEDPAESDINSS